MAVPRSFTDKVAAYGGFDPDATYQLLNQWQPYEGGHTNNNAAYNYLNTTQGLTGSEPSINSVGVKAFASEDDGARATAQTLLNGNYPSIASALKSGDLSDVNGIARDVRVWTSGKPDGGSNFADSLQGGGVDMSGGGGEGGTVAVDEPWTGKSDQLDLILEELMGDRPDRNDPAFIDPTTGEFDPLIYGEALKTWAGNVSEIAAAGKQIRLASIGLTTLPDGTMIALGDLPPDQAKAIDDANYNVYASVLNKLGLDQFDLRRQRQLDENDVKTSDFANKLNALDASIAYDDLNLKQATTNIDRSLSGMQESRNRAQLVLDAQDQIRKYGTAPGKTNYSLLDIAPGLFKASGSNIDPSLIQINYTGTQHIDPDQLLADYDAKLGVSGPLPSVPSLVTQPGQIPQAPALSPIDTPLPSLLAPKPPASVMSKPSLVTNSAGITNGPNSEYEYLPDGTVRRKQRIG